MRLLVIFLMLIVSSSAQFDMGEDYDDGDYMGGDIGGYGDPGSGEGDAVEKIGILNLDYITFDKIVGGDFPVLVRFEKEFSHGPEDSAFTELGIKSEGSSLVVATISINEYVIEHPNRRFVERFKLAMSDFPVYMLFAENSKGGVTFNGNKASADSIVKFVEGQGIYMVLAGCLREFDQFAMRFMVDKSDRKEVLWSAEAEAAKLTGDLEKSAKHYVQIMKKVLEKGESFIRKETVRVSKLASDRAVQEAKRAQFVRRLNILKSFSSGEDAS